MPDDKAKVGKPDRRTLAEGEAYEVEHFARKHNIPMAEARRLIQLHGNNRKALAGC